MSTTQVSSDKIRAYTATSYRLGHSDTDIILKIGTLSPPVLELFKYRQVTCGAFLTAFNPRGSQQLDAENEQAHARLVTEILNLELSFIEGSGSEEGTLKPEGQGPKSERNPIAASAALNRIFRGRA